MEDKKKDVIGTYSLKQAKSVDGKYVQGKDDKVVIADRKIFKSYADAETASVAQNGLYYVESDGSDKEARIKASKESKKKS